MSNELTALQKELGLSASTTTKKELSALLGGDYLPELRIVSSGELVQKFKQAVGTFCKKKGDSVVNLGEEIDIIALDHHPKAIDFNEGVTCYDLNSTLFRTIMGKASGSDSGCVFGLEFLVYLPSVKAFVSYHANSVTARKASDALLDLTGKVVHGSIYMAENKRKQTWQAPRWEESDAKVDSPPTEEAREVLAKFKAMAEAKAPEPVEDANAGREV